MYLHSVLVCKFAVRHHGDEELMCGWDTSWFVVLGTSMQHTALRRGV